MPAAPGDQRKLFNFLAILEISSYGVAMLASTSVDGRERENRREGGGCMRIWELFRLAGFLPVAYREGGLLVCLGLWGGWE